VDAHSGVRLESLTYNDVGLEILTDKFPPPLLAGCLLRLRGPRMTIMIELGLG
jgi:hypothetical protein